MTPQEIDGDTGELYAERYPGSHQDDRLDNFLVLLMSYVILSGSDVQERASYFKWHDPWKA